MRDFRQKSAIINEVLFDAVRQAALSGPYRHLSARLEFEFAQNVLYVHADSALGNNE